MGNMDVRLIALILAILGGIAGWVLPLYILWLITGIVLAIMAWALFEVFRAPAEGGLGLFILAVGSTVCLLVPMWIVYGLGSTCWTSH